MTQKRSLTPLMQQYFSVKEEHVDTLLLFQVGDFYELFFDDAKTVAAFLHITLTRRGEIDGEPIPLCGFPIHAADHYIEKLIKSGFKVALCDQLEPATAGKMVARGITQILTPSTLISEKHLDAKSNSYLLSFFPTKSGFGLLFSELLSSQLHATILPYDALKQLENELYRFLPDEILLLRNSAMNKYLTFFQQRDFFTTDYALDIDESLLEEERAWITHQFDAPSQKTLLEKKPLLYATVLWKNYLQKNNRYSLESFTSVQWYEPHLFLQLDGATQKNLDLIKNSFDGSRNNTLLAFMDRSITSMGSRMIKRWILAPLMHQDIIMQRQEMIETLINNHTIFQQLRTLLPQCGDVQRMVGRIALDKAHPQDYGRLTHILSMIPFIKQLLSQLPASLSMIIDNQLALCTALQKLLEKACDVDNHEILIKKGFDEELDRLRDLMEHSAQNILTLEQAEQERTGIKSLKIRHNQISGYYIEVTQKTASQVPDDYIEQQSLVNYKRFTNKTLQTLQYQIVHAESNWKQKEKELFQKLKEQSRAAVPELRSNGEALAILDALMSFATIASDHGYVKPTFNDKYMIAIKNGKHPIVASNTKKTFITNSTLLTEEQRVWIITGPNMGGKSTYLRQVALICLLAQIGSFVPAESASLPMLDRIFTRIGAGDHLAEGKSTFLIEMEETAQICVQATEKSLIILDEVGRGTSTYDGLALAQAIIEYIVVKIKARCLFATHYHELTSLEKEYTQIASYYMKSKKTDMGILFLHTLVRGVADGSFGIEVAKLAHLPYPVIQRAESLLTQLNHASTVSSKSKVTPAIIIKNHSSSEIELLTKIKELDVDAMTPRQALEFLATIKEQIITEQ